jgi:hypothetical protein
MKITIIRQHYGNGEGPFYILRLTVANVVFMQLGCFKSHLLALKARDRILKISK